MGLDFANLLILQAQAFVSQEATHPPLLSSDMGVLKEAMKSLGK
jgi:hypothetical protein